MPSAAIEDLRWLGIRWQEGPDKGGPYRALRAEQAPRSLPGRVAQAAAAAAACFHAVARARTSKPHWARRMSACKPGAGAANSTRWTTSRSIPAPAVTGLAARRSFPAPRPATLETPGGSNWRFRVPDGEVIEFVDRNLGPQRFVAGEDFGDFVVWRRDGVPSYQLACVVDDAAMRITEVVRGADLLKSTARQILLNRALGFDNPAWFHCRLVVDHNGRRLAKRHDALSLRALRQRGLTPMNILSAELPSDI